MKVSLGFVAFGWLLVGLTGCFNPDEPMPELDAGGDTGSTTTFNEPMPTSLPTSTLTSTPTGAGSMGASDANATATEPDAETSQGQSSTGSLDCESDCDPPPPPDNLNNPIAVRVHDGYVYFGEGGDTGVQNGAVRRFPVNDPTIIENIAVGVDGPHAFVFDAESIYFYETRGPNANLWRAPFDGPPTASERLLEQVDVNGGNTPPSGLAYSATTDAVYIFDGYDLHRRNADGSLDTVVLTATSHGLLADDAYIYFDYGRIGQRLAVGFSPLPAPTLEPIDTFTTDHSARGAAQDEDYVYWSTESFFGGAEIRRVAKDGRSTTVIVDDIDPLSDDDGSFAFDIAIDRTHVYYVTSAPSSRVFRAELVADAEPELLAETEAPFGITVDETYVYFTDTRAIRRQRKFAR